MQDRTTDDVLTEAGQAVYQKIYESLSSASEHAAQSADMGAFLFALHADKIASVISEARGEAYTALDYMRNTFLLNIQALQHKTLNEGIETGNTNILFQAAAMRPENKQYVLTSKGELDYGAVHSDIVADNGTMIPKGSVRLFVGFHVGGDTTSNGAGLAHIQKHSYTLRKVFGYKNSEEAIKDVLDNFSIIETENAAYGMRLLLTRRIDDSHGIRLTLDSDYDSGTNEHFYSIISLRPATERQMKKYTKKALSFSGRPTPSTDSGIGASGASVGTIATISGTPEVLLPSKESAFVSLSIAEIQGIVNQFTYSDESNSTLPRNILFQSACFDDNAVRILEKMQEQEKVVLGSMVEQENGQRVITLFENANETTFLHEMGHLFLNDLERLAPIDPESSQDLKTVMDWAEWHEGAAEEYKGTPLEQEFMDRERRIRAAAAAGQQETVLCLKQEWAQERFARGFEEYLGSGKAPAAGLQQVFEKFKGWMQKVYHGFRHTGGQATPEVEQIMARMIAPAGHDRPIQRAAQLDLLSNFTDKRGMLDFKLLPDDDASRKYIIEAFTALRNDKSAFSPEKAAETDSSIIRKLAASGLEPARLQAAQARYSPAPLAIKWKVCLDDMPPLVRQDASSIHR